MTVKDDGSVNLQEELGGKGRAILTSSSSTQYSFEQEGSELSIYTRYLVEGIENGAADKDGDGKISADELHEYASDKVSEAAPAMTPKFYPVEEGYKIFLAKSPKDDPNVKYRREVEIRAQQNQGKFSPFARRLLDGKRVEWGISEADAKIIEAEVLQPFREYERKLQEYEQALMQAIEAEYPFSKSTEADLKAYQTYLGLRDEDIAAIDSRVIPQREIPPTPLKKGGFDANQGGFDAQRDLSASENGDFVPVSPASVPVPPFSRGVRGDRTFEFEVATISLIKNGEKITTQIQRSRKRAEFFTENLGNGVRLEMVAIPGGTFLMGSPNGEAERLDREGPQHSVTIKSFFIGKFAVTQAQWREVAGFPKVNINLNADPSRFKGENRPVEQVLWYEALEFCARLSQKSGRNYRLPSEAEWEYACRAGTITPFHFGETIATDLANYCGVDETINGTLYKGSYGNGVEGVYRKQTTDVGSFPANAFGLYDMHGNVWEWCADHWHENYNGAPIDGSPWLTDDKKAQRLLRGGSWGDKPRFCRSAFRNYIAPDFRINDLGFRVACSLP